MRLSIKSSTFLAAQAAATWLLECPDVARQQLLWQKATQEDVMRREAAAQKEKEARKKLVSRSACPRLSFCSSASMKPHKTQSLSRHAQHPQMAWQGPPVNHSSSCACMCMCAGAAC